jgi:hypothetical protein
VDAKVIKDNAREIDTYLEVLVPMFEPQGGIPDVPMSRKERGTSRAPINDYVVALWKTNVYAGAINKVLEKALHGPDGLANLDGIRLYEILGICLYDHTAIRMWKDFGGLPMRRFKNMCMLLAYLLAEEYDHNGTAYRIKVWIRPEHAQQRAANREAQKITTFYTRQQMVEQLEDLESELGKKGQLAIEILVERARKRGLDWSVPKIRRAREVVNRVRREKRQVSRITDRMLVDLQAVAIELEENEKDQERHLQEMATLRDAVNHNADIYRRDMQQTIDLIRDALTGGNGNIHTAFAEIQRIHLTGREEVKSAREGQVA